MRRTLVVLGAVMVAASLAAPVGAQPSSPDIDRPQPRVIGGTDVPDGRYPFMMAMRRFGSHACGGSLIAPEWVLTAAHCLTDSSGTPDITAANVDIVIGRYDLTTTDGEVIAAADLNIHPLWNGDGDGSFAYDFALIELVSAATEPPVALATSSDSGLHDESSDTATVMGWGATAEGGGGFPDMLKEVDVPIVPDAICTDPAVWGSFVDPDREMCAGDDDVDSCVGDSGGPLIALPGTSGWKQIGIVSSGPLPCADPDLPGIYAEVAAGLPWISTLAGPLAFDNAYSLDEDDTLTTTAGVDGVADNDTDPEDTTPAGAVTLIDPPTHDPGFVLNADGSFTYDPDPDFNGTDTFSYTVADSNGNVSNPATVNLTISAVNDPPSFTKGADETVAQDAGAQSVPGWATGISAGPADESAQTVSFVVVNDNNSLFADPPAIDATGALTYTPALPGSSTVSVTAMDDGGGADTSPPQSFTITIEPSEIVVDTPGLVDVTAGKWHLRNSLGDITSFFYGNPGDLPIAGDWDGDGTATPGLYRQTDGFFYARNSNSEGVADTECFAGDPADVPLSGDWDGDGDDNLGLYRPSEQRFYLFTVTCTGTPMGAAQISLLFGNPGDKPVSGDWDADGVDEIGLHRESTGLFYWRKDLTTGNANGQIIFGNPNDRFVAGDWGIIDGIDTPTLFRPSDLTFYFRHTLTQGNADSQFVWDSAGSGWLPVSGVFGLG